MIQLPNIKNYIPKEEMIMPTIYSKYSHSVPHIVQSYGKISGKLMDLPFMLPHMIGCFKAMKTSYKSAAFQPEGHQHITEADHKDLMTLLNSKDLSHIGFTSVNPNYIFKNKAILFPHAIVITMAMSKDKIKTAPSIKAGNEIFRTYKALGYIVNEITDFLKSRGYKAHAGPALGGEVNYPMLAQDAKIGVVGKHGLLIGPNTGPSLRIAAVYTDIANLPTAPNEDITWIQDFCNKCNRCVKACPSQAIYENSIVLKDNSKVCIDYKKCALPFSVDHGCTICVKSCSFFNGDYNKIKEHNESI